MRLSPNATRGQEWLYTDIGIAGSLAGNWYGVDAGVKNRQQVDPEVDF